MSKQERILMSVDEVYQIFVDLCSAGAVPDIKREAICFCLDMIAWEARHIAE